MPQGPRDSSTTEGPRGPRVLCLDDEPAIVRITVRQLERLGYRVTGETDARKALAAFEAAPESIDALITDHSMPGLTGIELVRAFRRVRPDLPVVLTSGLIDEDVSQSLAELGIDHVVLKPHTTQELASALGSALAARAGHDDASPAP
jgi:CheY-like chemotaxis protein